MQSSISTLLFSISSWRAEWLFCSFQLPNQYQLGAQLQGTLFMLYLTGRDTIHRKYNVNEAPLSAIHRTYNVNGASWSCALPPWC